MVKTGYISFFTDSGGGFDANGNPIAVTKTQSDFIPCNIKTITKDLQLLVDGQYVRSSYSVIVENIDVYQIDLTNVIEIQLQDINNNSLGRFQLQRKDYFALTNKTKFVV